MSYTLMHIVQMHPGFVTCSCGFSRTPITNAGVKQAGTNHAEWHRPSLLIDYRKCSEKCRNGAATRNLHISLHDAECDNQEKDE